jgi:hypothetical protein
MRFAFPVLVLSLISFLVYGCVPKNIEYVKERHVEKWRKQGFECIDYDGWTGGFGVGPYGGSAVWCRLRRIPDNGVIYDGYIQRWGDELHVYGPKPVDGQVLNLGGAKVSVE